MLDVNALSSTITTIAVIVGLAFAIQQIRDLKKVREGEVILQVQQQITSEFSDYHQTILRLEVKDYDDFMQKFRGSPEELAFVKVGGFFEGLGVLVRRRVIPLGLVDDFFHGIIRLTWLKTEKIVIGYRKAMNWPEFEESFEYLYHKTKDYRKLPKPAN